MNVHNLGRIFDPKRIALVGASPNPNSVGGKVLSNLVTGGFPGVVYPVHPTQEAVLGIPCFADVAGLPRVPDLAIVCTPAEQVPAAVAACGEAGIRALRSLFNWATHEAATRHYYIDYAREIAIVAEIEAEEGRCGSP